MSWLGKRIKGISGGLDEYGNYLTATLTFDDDSVLRIGVVTERRLYEASQALKMCLTRDTGQPDHDYTTCGQLSCVMGRRALRMGTPDTQSGKAE